MGEIQDRFGTGCGTAVDHVHAGEILVARAVLRIFKGCIDDVLVLRRDRPQDRTFHRGTRTKNQIAA